MSQIKVSPSGVVVEIPLEQLREALGSAAPPRVEISEIVPLEEIERRYVAHVLGAVNGNKSQAAKLLGISRRSLYRYLARGEAAA